MPKDCRKGARADVLSESKCRRADDKGSEGAEDCEKPIQNLLVKVLYRIQNFQQLLIIHLTILLIIVYFTIEPRLMTKISLCDISRIFFPLSSPGQVNQICYKIFKANSPCKSNFHRHNKYASRAQCCPASPTFYKILLLAKQQSAKSTKNIRKISDSRFYAYIFWTLQLGISQQKRKRVTSYEVLNMLINVLLWN